MQLRLKKICLLGAYSLLAIPMSANADNASKNREIAERFAKCDTNHDGKLTKAEANGCMPRIYSHFDYIDSSKKGYLTVAEIQAVADN
jgi:hypothetical protein